MIQKENSELSFYQDDCTFTARLLAAIVTDLTRGALRLRSDTARDRVDRALFFFLGVEHRLAAFLTGDLL